MYTFMEGVHFYVHSPFLITACFIPSQALMREYLHFSGLLGSMVFKVCKSSLHVSVIHILKFHYLENSISISDKCPGRLLHSTIRI